MSDVKSHSDYQTLSLHSWHRHFSLIAARQQLCGVGTINFVNALSLA
jgi:hypothetical protein